MISAHRHLWDSDPRGNTRDVDNSTLIPVRPPERPGKPLRAEERTAHVDVEHRVYLLSGLVQVSSGEVRAAATTSAPPSARRIAIRSPIPRPAPVTTAVLPSRSTVTDIATRGLARLYLFERPSGSRHWARSIGVIPTSRASRTNSHDRFMQYSSPTSAGTAGSSPERSESIPDRRRLSVPLYETGHRSVRITSRKVSGSGITYQTTSVRPRERDGIPSHRRLIDFW